MESFKTLKSQAIPLDLNDVDTDLIIPAQYLTSISRQGFGQNLFRRLKDSDPNFVFNQERYHKAQILIANNNFGCGSSREHAVWALQGAGIRVVIAKSFADIFASNSAKNGLLLICLEASLVDQLRAEATQSDLTISVNLEELTVSTSQSSATFEYDPFRRHCLLNGLDDLDYILSQSEAVQNHRKTNADNRFFSSLQFNHPQK